MGDFRLERPELLASVVVVLAFWGFFGVYALSPYGHVVHLWGCVGSPESRQYHLNDLSIVLQSPSNVKHY